MFAAGGSCPNISDRIRGRRPGDLASFHESLCLQQHFDVIHTLTPAPEPQDIPPHLRHFAMMQPQIELCDKPLIAYSRGRAQVEQSFAMVQMAIVTPFALPRRCPCNTPRPLPRSR
jgi:trimethylamine--corrinoid protein Co-methyltransferase